MSDKIGSYALFIEYLEIETTMSIATKKFSNIGVFIDKILKEYPNQARTWVKWLLRDTSDKQINWLAQKFIYCIKHVHLSYSKWILELLIPIAKRPRHSLNESAIDTLSSWAAILGMNSAINEIENPELYVLVKEIQLALPKEEPFNIATASASSKDINLKPVETRQTEILHDAKKTGDLTRKALFEIYIDIDNKKDPLDDTLDDDNDD